MKNKQNNESPNDLNSVIGLGSQRGKNEMAPKVQIGEGVAAGPGLLTRFTCRVCVGRLEGGREGVALMRVLQGFLSIVSLSVICGSL